MITTQLISLRIWCSVGDPYSQIRISLLESSYYDC